MRANHRAYCLAGLLVLLFLGAGCNRNPRQESAPETGLGMCPVMTGHEAKEEFSVTHEGKTYYFCCNWCVGEFQENPEKYLRGDATPGERRHPER
jgi:YHS domain-containing protein